MTKRKHDQKKKQQREKSLAKYAPKEGEEDGDNDGEEEGDEIAESATSESDLYSMKAKSKPLAAGRKAQSQSQTGPSKPTGKPAPKKAPAIEDIDVDQFMDGSFLEDDNGEVDDKAVEDDDEDGEEDDEEMGEDGEDEDEAALLADIEAHEAELANLSKIDPEFYSHLKQHDKQLLEFSSKDIDEGEDEEEDEDATAEDEDADMKDEEQEVLTMDSLKELQKQCNNMSVKALKKLVRIFRSAIHIGSVSQVRSAISKGKKITQSEEQAAKEAQFRHEVAIHSHKVFHELIRYVLKEGAQIWGKHFAPEKGGKSATTTAAGTTAPSSQPIDKHSRWSSIGPILKAFLGHLLFFLSTLRSGEENGKMARFVLGNMEGLIKYYEPFPKLSSKLLKELLELWATSDHNVRIDAFLRIRQLAIELTSVHAGRGGENMLELTLKGIYLTYVKHTKFTSALTIPVIEFMANCVVEIYGIDPVLSYQHAFVYIRQMAIHLRQSLQHKTKESHRVVYNWNYINCCRVWAKVLGAHGQPSTDSAGTNGVAAAQDNLNALVYPFVQICLGTLGVLPSSRYFPLRFHIARFLIDLSRQTKVFIPLAPYLLSVFHAPELTKKPTASTRKVNEIQHVLKASKHVIATKTYQEQVVTEALALLLDYFGVFAYSIAFNELVLPTMKVLKKLSKEILIHRIRKQIQQFILKLEHNSSWITSKRSVCNFAPKDVAEKKGIDSIQSFKNGAGIGAVGEKSNQSSKNQIAPLEKYCKAQAEERKILEDTKADWVRIAQPKNTATAQRQ